MRRRARRSISPESRARSLSWRLRGLQKNKPAHVPAQVGTQCRGWNWAPACAGARHAAGKQALRPDRRAFPSTVATGLEQEPGAFLGFVRPVVDNALRGVVARLRGGGLRGAQGLHRLQIILAQFVKYVDGADIPGIIFEPGLTT